MSTLSEAVHTIKATATDVAANSKAATDLSLTVDRSAAAPTDLDLDAASDSGSSSTDNITKTDTGLKLSGKTEAGSSVEVYDGTPKLGDATVGSDGTSWSFTSGALSEGNHSIMAYATDVAGNTSAASSALSVTIDKTAPLVTPGNFDGGTTWYSSKKESFTASDSGSGLVSSADASFDLTASTESTSVTTPTVASKTVYDKAGNSTMRSVSALIDATKPETRSSLSAAHPQGSAARSTDPLTLCPPPGGVVRRTSRKRLLAEPLQGACAGDRGRPQRS